MEGARPPPAVWSLGIIITQKLITLIKNNRYSLFTNNAKSQRDGHSTVPLYGKRSSR